MKLYNFLGIVILFYSLNSEATGCIFSKDVDVADELITAAQTWKGSEEEYREFAQKIVGAGFSDQIERNTCYDFVNKQPKKEVYYKNKIRYPTVGFFAAGASCIIGGIGGIKKPVHREKFIAGGMIGAGISLLLGYFLSSSYSERAPVYLAIAQQVIEKAPVKTHACQQLIKESESAAQ